MKLNKTAKIILVLAVVSAVILIILLVTKNSSEKDPDSSSASEQTPVSDTASTGTSSSDTTMSEPDSTSDETTSPDDIVNPPSNYMFSKTLRSDSSTPLNLRIELTGELLDNGEVVKVTAELYLEHRSIYIGSRSNCRIWIEDSSEVFTLQPISCDSDEYGEILIATAEKICKYKDTLNVGAQLPCRVTYSGVNIDMLEVVDTIVIE